MIDKSKYLMRMGKVGIRQCTAKEAAEIFPFLRQADIDEIKALGLSATKEALRDRLKNVKHLYIIEEFQDDFYGLLPIGIFGVAKTESPKIGAIFLQGSGRIAKNITAVGALMNAMFYLWRRHYSVLFNNVWIGNKTHINWLKKVGFELFEEVEHTGTGEKFIPFKREI